MKRFASRVARVAPLLSVAAPITGFAIGMPGSGTRDRGFGTSAVAAQAPRPRLIAVLGADQKVPILLRGHRIKPGRYGERVSPADIAPTLAYLAGVSLPDADGRVLPGVIR